MTKFFRLFALVLTMAALAPTANATTPDVNLDNAVDVVDVQTTVNIVLATSMPQWTGQGDVNGDVTVDVVDVQTLVNEILGLSTAALAIPDPGPVLARPVGLPWVRRVFALGGGIGATKTFSLGPGAPAWLSITSDGELRGTPPSVGQFAFILNVTTGGAPVLRPMSLTVSNQIPLVENEIVYVTAGATYSSAINGVLANDVDPDGHVLTATKIMDPLVGQMVLLTTGFFNYVIPANAEGVHGMAYEVSDGFGGVVRGSVKFIIIPANDTEIRAEDIVIPGMVQTGSSTRVTMAYRVPVGQSVTAVIAQIENTASIASLSPHTSGTLSPGATLWSATLATTGLAAGVHKVIITASVNGGPEIVRTRRIVVYTGTPLRVGPGAYPTTYDALLASVQGGAIVVDPGLYSSQFGVSLNSPLGGVLGSTHGPHALRVQMGGFGSEAGETRTLYGVTINQVNPAPTFQHNYVRSQGSGASVVMVSCKLIGLGTPATTSTPNAIDVQSNARAEILDCEIVDWYTAEDIGGGTSSPSLSSGAAITISTGSRVLMEDCRVIRCGHTRLGTGRIGGAIVVQGEFNTPFQSEITVKRTQFRDCFAWTSENAYGGAIGVTWATANLEDCVFEGNKISYPSPLYPPVAPTSSSYVAGGAIVAYQWGVINLFRCTFLGNSAQTQSAIASSIRVRSAGGALAAIGHSSIVADQCEFRDNFVSLNPGFINHVRGSVATVQRGSALRIENSRVIANGAFGSGRTLAAPFQVGGSDLGSNLEANVGARLTMINTLMAGNIGDGTSSLVRSEVPTSVSTPVPNQVILHHCTISDIQPTTVGGSVTGTVLHGTYGTLYIRDSIIWAPTIPAINWSGGGSTIVLHSTLGPVPSLGVATAANNLTTDPLFAPSGSWLLLPTSPAINAGTSLAQVSGLGPRSALDNLSPDTGQVDLGYHAPIPSAGVIPFTTTDAYTQGHLLGLHAAYAAPPPP